MPRLVLSDDSDTDEDLYAPSLQTRQRDNVESEDEVKDRNSKVSTRKSMVEG